MSVARMKDVDVYIHVGQISPITAYHKESHISMLQDSHDNLFIIYTYIDYLILYHNHSASYKTIYEQKSPHIA